MDGQIVDMTLNLKTIALLIPPSLLRIRFLDVTQWGEHRVTSQKRAVEETTFPASAKRRADMKNSPPEM